jgi:hypothetical protein
MSTNAKTSSNGASAAQGAGTAKRAAAKRAAAKRAPRVKPKASTEKATTTTTTARNTANPRSATRKRTTATHAGRLTPPSTIETIGGYAERAVLIPVGAALLARDRLVAGVGELPRNPSSAAQEQLRRFERRGASARNGLEREARRTRVRLERELRRRRRSLDRAVGDLDKRRDAFSRNVTGQVEEASTHIERTVQARVKDAASLANKVQDRFRDLV